MPDVRPSASAVAICEDEYQYASAYVLSIMSESQAGPSRGPKRLKTCESSVGLSEKDVKNILTSLGNENLYLTDSEEDPFVDSGSEYIPSSDESGSETHDILEENILENEQQIQEQEAEEFAVGTVVNRKELEIFWTKDEFVPKLHVFDTSYSGVTNESLTEESKEIDFFLNLFTENITDIILQETNRYAQQQNAEAWKDLELPELFVYLALTLLMPRNKKLCLKEYWSQANLLHTPIFGQKMSRDRYFEIQRYLHFSNNQDAPPNDCLFKVGNVLNKLKERFKSEFYPFQNLVVDESMVLFKGRLNFKQYIKTKKHRFGIKLYVLCDCETGIVLDFIVYTGKETNIKTIDIHGLGSSGAVVTKLLDDYLNKGHSFFSDNFYTSPALSTFLFEKKTNSCGTVRQNRKQMPIFDKKLKSGETDWRSAEHLFVLKWKDRRDVVMLSTMHENKMVTLPRINRTTNENVVKPLCVVEYNKQMGAVDRSDMMISSVDCTRKSLKWYRKLFFHCLDLTMLNAHAMYLTRCTKKVPFAKFHLAVIRQLLERYQSKQLNPIHHDLGNARLNGRHFPAMVPRKEGAKKAARRCRVCSHTTRGERKRKDTSYMCQQCDVGLCIVPCFQIYHEVAEY